MSNKQGTVVEHYQKFFKGHNIKIFPWNSGPIKNTVPDFKVMQASPGPRLRLWSYCSIGASNINHENLGALEFVVHSEDKSPKLIEILAKVVYYHSKYQLGIGHTLPIGEPWLGKSKCDHLLVTAPYPLGPKFGICNYNRPHVHILWLLPITEKERIYKVEHGLEALESIFEEKGLKYWDVKRKSVV